MKSSFRSVAHAVLKPLVAFCSLFAGLMTVSAQSYSFMTWAGSSPQGHADGVGRAALFDEPRDVAIDPSGNLFVADTGNHVIRKITPDGVVSTFAGTPRVAGSEDGPGALARFTYPGGLTVDRAGNVYVADNQTIRKVTPAGLVTTVAGRAGERGSADGTGGAARFAFNYGPAFFFDYYNSGDHGGLVADREGNIYVADYYNSTIRKVTADGVVTTFAGKAGQPGGPEDGEGNREAVRFYLPRRLSMDGTGNLFVAGGWSNSTLRRIAPDGEVTSVPIQGDQVVLGVVVDATDRMYCLTWYGVSRVSSAGVIVPVAGSLNAQTPAEDGNGSAAHFSSLRGLILDPSGNIIVADTGNHAIRRITADGVVTTVAGNPPAHVDARGRAARFRSPRGLTIDSSGIVYVSDGGAIRKITPGGAVTTVASAVTPPSPNVTRVHLAVDGSGNVFVAETDEYSLLKVSPSGVVTTVATFDRAGGVWPSGLAADRTGNVYFTSGDDTIRKVSPDGSITVLARGAFKPGNIAVGNRGDVFVTAGSAVFKISPKGAVTTVAGGRSGRQDGIGTAARFGNLFGIAVDGADNIFVNDSAALRRITDGKVTTLAITWNEDGRIPTTSPFSLVVDDSGGIYACGFFPCTVSKGIPLSTQAESRLVNTSVRANLRTQQPLMVGFNLHGSARPVLLRAIGPGLQPFVSGIALAGDPSLTLFDRSGMVVATNDNWGGVSDLTAAFASAGAFPLALGSTDAALVRTVAGQNMLHITSPSSGMTLFELFDVGPAATSSIANFSARHVIGSGADASFSLGFTIEGGPKTVLIRAMGPTLTAAPFNISTALRFPNLTVFNARGQVLALWERDWWRDFDLLQAIFERVGAFPLWGVRGWGDPWLLLTLQPGSYSAVLGGYAGAVGDALIEIYDVP